MSEVKYRKMPTETLLYEQKIIELEKKLREKTDDLALCRKENEEFIYNAAHDLQAPLRKLSTFIERLVTKSRGTLGDDAKTYIEKIEQTVTAMRSAIDGLSALADITAADFSRCDLNKLFNEVLQESSSLIEQSQAQVDLCLLPSVEGNHAQLKLVFKNIIENSAKFQNKNRALHITIRCSELTPEEKAVMNLPEPKLYYKIEIADNGIGFHQVYADRILKPFQRLHGKSEYEGDGLGLAICQKIINMHDGQIYAEGNENSGSVFVLVLPKIQQ